MGRIEATFTVSNPLDRTQSTVTVHQNCRINALLFCPHWTLTAKFLSNPLMSLSSICFSSCSYCSKGNAIMHEQGTGSVAIASLPCTSERSSGSALQLELKEGMESDDEIRRVPEIVGEAAGPITSGNFGAVQPSAGGSKRRGRNPADKENKRLKRLLRNRVSAQQARERKKAYLVDLETRVKILETKNAELEERVSNLQNENQMLRQILKNTTAEGRK